MDMQCGPPNMTFGSLFAGIGGIDLGLERAGLQCRWQVEINPWCRRVLAKHWPNIPRHDDVTTFPPNEGDWSVDLIAGGFPCQDISFAGRGAGLDGERSGLFFQAARVIRVLEPRYVLLENVGALLVRGLDAVLGTLASLGYDAEWHCLQAADVGAPHLRDRVFILGHLADAGGERPERRGRSSDMAGTSGASQEDREKRQRDGDAAEHRGAVVADAASGQRHDFAVSRPIQDQGRVASGRPRCGLPDADRQRQSQPQGLVGEIGRRLGDFRSEVGLAQWGVDPAEIPESGVGRMAPRLPNRVDRLRGLGNAVVPQVAEFWGRVILEHAAASPRP